jgi:hypothetical protein
MDTRIAHKLGTLALGAALAVAAFPSVAAAADRPSYASPDEDTVHGRIVAIDDDFHISVRDDNGYVDHVQLHQGTIINPTGLSLHPGMVVTVLGFNHGPTLDANEIDTPYNVVPAYGYAYPAYYPHAYYPPIAIGLGFHFR